MANDLNTVFLIGRLTHDPVIKDLPSGRLAEFSLANNRTFVSNNEEREDKLFIECKGWKGLADVIARTCHKGKQVAVTGRLKMDTWQTPEGHNRSKIFISVDHMQLLADRGQGAAVDRANDTGYQSPAPPMSGRPPQRPAVPPEQVFPDESMPF